jgi:hypothetical protein
MKYTTEDIFKLLEASEWGLGVRFRGLGVR